MCRLPCKRWAFAAPAFCDFTPYQIDAFLIFIECKKLAVC